MHRWSPIGVQTPQVATMLRRDNGLHGPRTFGESWDNRDSWDSRSYRLRPGRRTDFLYMRLLVPTFPPAAARRASWHIPSSGVYPANLCPLSSGVEFASLGEDFGQSVGEPIKAVSGRAVWQGSPEHL